MADSSLPPSRFSAGYIVGPSQAAESPPTSSRTLTPVPPAGTVLAGSHTDGPVTRVNPLAAASLMLVLFLGPFVAVATLPMGLVARGQISRSCGAGRGLATASIALSCAYLAAGVVLIALAIITGNAPHD